MPSATVTISTTAATVVAAPATGGIRVLGYQVLSAGNPGRVALLSNATEKAAVSSFTDNGGGICCPPTNLGYFDCAAGELLKASPTVTGVNVDINVQYAVY